MLRKKPNRQTYEQLNDGFLIYGNEENKRVNGRLISTVFQEVGTLAFNYKTIRESDYTLFSNLANITTLKVKTYFDESVDVKKHKVKIDDEIYNITRLDNDETRSYMFWYLERESKR